MATILQLKVAKRQLFEKVSLECSLRFNLTCNIFFYFQEFKISHSQLLWNFKWSIDKVRNSIRNVKKCLESGPFCFPLSRQIISSCAQGSQLNPQGPVTPVTVVTSKCYSRQSASTSRSIGDLSNANKTGTTFCISHWVNYWLLVAFAMYLSSVLVVKVSSLFADQGMTEQSLRVSATLKYGRHIEFINLNPGLSQM